MRSTDMIHLLCFRIGIIANIIGLAGIVSAVVSLISEIYGMALLFGIGGIAIGIGGALFLYLGRAPQNSLHRD